MLFLNFLMCVCMFCLYVCLCTKCMPVPIEARGTIRASGTGVADCYELPVWALELNSCPLKEHPVFLTAEPSLHPLSSGNKIL